MDPIFAEQLPTLLTIIGAPIFTLFGWVQMQLKAVKSDVENKVGRVALDREISSVREVVSIKSDKVEDKLEDMSARFTKMEDKLDRMLERLN